MNIDSLKRFEIARWGLRALLHYSFCTPKQVDDTQLLDNAMRWLCLAQDVREGAGVDVAYTTRGWSGVGYPETSGYIIETYIRYGHKVADPLFFDRAKELGDWEISLQHSSGGIPSNPKDLSVLRIFNTGQVMLGWLELFRHTGDSRFIDAALRAGDFLVAQQDRDGSWRTPTHCGHRVYHARSAWPLLELGLILNRDGFIAAACRNLDWVLSQQNANGWFRNCDIAETLPNTHAIGYTLRGLLESDILLSNCAAQLHGIDLRAAVLRAAYPLRDAILVGSRSKGRLLAATYFDENWIGHGQHSCLTGNLQLAIVFLKLASLGFTEFRDAGVSLIDGTSQCVWHDSHNTAIRGAVPGSWPIHIGYVPCGFPNWATKFFADAIMLRGELG